MSLLPVRPGVDEGEGGVCPARVDMREKEVCVQPGVDEGEGGVCPFN